MVRIIPAEGMRPPSMLEYCLRTTTSLLRFFGAPSPIGCCWRA